MTGCRSRWRHSVRAGSEAVDEGIETGAQDHDSLQPVPADQIVDAAGSTSASLPLPARRGF